MCVLFLAASHNAAGLAGLTFGASFTMSSLCVEIVTQGALGVGDIPGVIG